MGKRVLFVKLNVAVILTALAVPVFGINQVLAAPSPVNVYRMYNPSTGEHLYTSSLNERVTNSCSYPGYKTEGNFFSVASTSYNNNTPIYGLFNSKTGDHFYTPGISERDGAVNNGYAYDGIVFYAYTSSLNGQSPVYRLYNQQTKLHFYAFDNNNRQVAINNGYVDETVGFWAFPTGIDIAPVQRLFKSSNGDHYYTIVQPRATEQDATSCINPQFKYEGVAFRAYGSDSGGTPINRYRQTADFYQGTVNHKGMHFYTSSPFEAKNAQVGYVDEGPAFYTLSGSNPVYRLYSGSTGDHFYTVDVAEKNAAISSGYYFDGAAFSADPCTTNCNE